MPDAPRDISPARGARAVTANDSTNIHPTRALWIGGAGDVAVWPTDTGSAVTLAGVAAGSLIPISVTRVLSTGTTATSIVALY